MNTCFSSNTFSPSALCLPFIFLFLLSLSVLPYASESAESIDSVLKRVRSHDFSHNSGYDGVGDMQDQAWRVRTLAIRDLLRNGEKGIPKLRKNLFDADSHVRHVCAMTLGLLKAKSASDDLRKVLQNDKDQIVQCEAALALGYLGLQDNLPFLKSFYEKEKDKEIKDRCKLSIGRLEELGDAPTNTEAYLSLDESQFHLAKVGEPAPDFTLKDTTGKTWKLSDFKGQKVALIWIFADWCPVCHHEFHDLITMEKEFKAKNIQVMTLECHNEYRCQVMVNKRDLWWPHLIDDAGITGNKYGVDTMEFTVHDEWINRPSTILIDEKGIVQFAYYGTYWGDRPSIKETLDIMVSEKYEFVHPKRRVAHGGGE